MRLTLHITAGPDSGRKIHLRQGQVAQFGRTEWADFSFPRDGEMADVHFQIDCGPQSASLRRLPPAGPVWVNEQEVSQSALQPGDRIRAGATTLTVLVDGQQIAAAVAGVAAVAAAEGDAAAEPAPPPEATPLQICDELDFGDEPRAIAASAATLAAFQQALEEQQQFTAALRLQAHRFPPRLAVWWGIQCVAPLGPEAFPPDEQAAHEAARQWALEPDETRRRDAERAAAATKYELPGSWLAMAAFWSGNLAPPGLDEIPPDASLSGGAVTSALMIAAYLGDPIKAEQRMRQFLAQARQVAERGVPAKRP